MAWGSFIKKIKSFGDKAAQKIGQFSRTVGEKVLPTARKIHEATKVFNPYSGIVDQGLDWLETATKKGSKLQNSSDLVDLGMQETGAKQWLQSRGIK
jgi:hypothetical protein